MFGKGSRLYSVFRMKCPRCHEGDFFISHPYNLKKAGDIHENCPNCGLKYSKEPGFYYGAMYVSYALGVGLFVALWVALNYLIPLESNRFANFHHYCNFNYLNTIYLRFVQDYLGKFFHTL